MIVAARFSAVNGSPQSERVLTVDNLRAYYQTRYFGIKREVRAVDGVTLHVDRNEVYGLAGESSCGKTTLIKTIVRAIRPPLNVVGGSVTFNFAGRDRDIYALNQSELENVRWRHLSYILQSSTRCAGCASPSSISPTATSDSPCRSS